MGLLMTRDEVLQGLKEREALDGTEKIFYGAMKPVASANYFWIVSNQKGLYLLGVTGMGKLSGEVAFLEKEAVAEVSSKTSMMGMTYNLTIKETDGQVYKFMVNKKVMGHKTQKEEYLVVVAAYER
jgi:hypothetical protein